MGCDIHTEVECQDEAGTWVRQEPGHEVFDWRSYNLFGWLGDVRNYSAVPSIASHRGLPDDASAGIRDEVEEWGYDAHSVSWVSLKELLEFDYDAAVEDRRVSIGNDGGHTAEPGGGEMTTYRAFLGPAFFNELETLKRLVEARPTRVVFWFDN